MANVLDYTIGYFSHHLSQFHVNLYAQFVRPKTFKMVYWKSVHPSHTEYLPEPEYHKEQRTGRNGTNAQVLR